MTDRRGSGPASLAGVGAAALVVVCCAAGPAVVALIAGLGIAGLLGLSGAVIAAFVLGTAVVVARRARRRTCRSTTRRE